MQNIDDTVYTCGMECFKFRFNLATETFSQTLAHPPDTYKKHKETYQFKRHGRMIEVSTQGLVKRISNPFYQKLLFKATCSLVLFWFHF